MKIKRKLCAALAVFISVSMISGCNKTNKSNEVVEYQEIVFPLKEKETINIWTANYASASVDNYSEMEMYKQLMERTNVDIKFTHPSSSGIAEQFNVMIASNELPDVFEQGQDYYRGGLSAAYDDGVIIDIMKYIDYAPNLKKIIEAYPQIKGEILDEEGRLLAFPIIRGGNNVRTYQGIVVRKDILEKYDVEIPKTIEEWYNALKTLKQNGVESPFTVDFNSLLKSPTLTGAFDVINDYFVENGEVKFGYYDERYKDFIAEMRKWYSEGLLDSDLMVNDGNSTKTKYINGQAAVTLASNGSFKSFVSTDPEYISAPAPYPSSRKVSDPYFIACDRIAVPVASITTQCKNPALAVTLIDYFYSKEGNLLANFGIEGETYTIENGLPVYTNLIMNNPDGKTMSQAGLRYSRVFSFGPFVQDKHYGTQWYGLDVQKQATEIWTENMDKYNEKNPVVRGTLTPDEMAQTTSKQTDINTYCSENIAKFILGEKSMDEYDEYLTTLKKMGIEDIIKIKQVAHDRFISKYPELKKGSSYEVSDLYWSSGE